MPDPFLGEIRIFAGNFAPQGWATCDGQLLLISQSSALFSLLGTTYGGNGENTFGLPDLRGRLPIHVGQGPGLTQRNWGAKAGSETAVVSTSQLPPHSHPVPATAANAASVDPAGKILARSSQLLYRQSGGALTPMHPDSILNSTDTLGLSHPNLQPFLTITFIIALSGIYPSRT